MADEVRRSSEKNAINELDRRFRKPLMSYFLRRLGDHSEAEDLTQQVFMRLVGMQEPRKIENADAYVFTIASNLLKDHARTHARKHAHTTSTPDFDLAYATIRELVEERSPERVLLAKESLSEVLKHLDELGSTTRDIFILFKLENIKQREIADLYGMGQSTVEKHVMKAALHLATRYRAL